jgi:SAM-dependent methyltransferase
MFDDAWTAVHAGQFRGKQVLDVGAGYARQSFVFALHGAYVTHLDVVKKNLDRIALLAKHYGIEDRVRTVYLTDVESAEKALEGRMFDAVLFLGSMHHMPREYIRREAHMYLQHLRPGGRLIHLAYPSARWHCHKEGLTFPEFCDSTDHSCPWAEWYDLEKALKTFHPFKFHVLYAGIVGVYDFTWWDLVLAGRE